MDVLVKPVDRFCSITMYLYVTRICGYCAGSIKRIERRKLIFALPSPPYRALASALTPRTAAINVFYKGDHGVPFEAPRKLYPIVIGVIVHVRTI